AKYDERYVIPPAHAEDAHNLEELATECSLDFDGGPGMGGNGPFGEGSGPVPPIAVESYQQQKTRQATPAPIDAPEEDARRINLLLWNGEGKPRGLFPE